MTILLLAIGVVLLASAPFSIRAVARAWCGDSFLRFFVVVFLNSLWWLTGLVLALLTLPTSAPM